MSLQPAEQEKTEDNDKEDAAARLQTDHRSWKHLEAGTSSKEFVQVGVLGVSTVDAWGP